MTEAKQCLCCGKPLTERIAEATDVEYFTTSDLFSYYRCSHCDVVCIDPVPRESLSLIYPKSYYSFVERSATFVERVKEWLDRRLFTRLISRIHANSLSVLDIGGGIGWLLTTIKNLDARVVKTQVVDIDQSAQPHAENAGHSFFRGRIEDFPLNSEYDLILALNLIEHVDNPPAVLRKISAGLRPGGLALLKTPNIDSLDAKLFQNYNWGGYHCPRHWVLFTRESFTRCAEAAGLRVREFRYTQGAPFWAVSTLTMLARKGFVSINRHAPLFTHRLFGVFCALFAVFDVARAPVSKLSQMIFVLEKAE